LEILADILLVARTGATKTEIVYQTNLNFGRTGGYLTYLEDKGLLENSGPIYTSTERGKAFARDFQLMNEVLRS
jgi:predicted transcriptional regulator